MERREITNVDKEVRFHFCISNIDRNKKDSKEITFYINLLRKVTLNVPFRRVCVIIRLRAGSLLEY